jgi:hypothetical protein
VIASADGMHRERVAGPEPPSDEGSLQTIAALDGTIHAAGWAATAGARSPVVWEVELG